MPIVLRDEVSAGVTTAGDLADFVPGIEDRLKSVVDIRGKVGGMGVVPEPQVALVAGQVARLREGRFDRLPRTAWISRARRTGPLPEVVRKDRAKLTMLLHDVSDLVEVDVDELVLVIAAIFRGPRLDENDFNTFEFSTGGSFHGLKGFNPKITICKLLKIVDSLA